MKEIKSSWDIPDKDGMYWVYSTIFKKVFIAELVSKRFYDLRGQERFDIQLTNITFCKYLSKPKIPKK